MARKTQTKRLVVPQFKKTRRSRKHYLKEWRKYRGLTLERAAELAGMTAGNISAMERYQQGYTPEGLAALAETYQTMPGWLIEFDPKGLHGFFDTIRSAKEEDRSQIFEIANQIAKTVISKTGTQG